MKRFSLVAVICFLAGQWLLGQTTFSFTGSQQTFTVPAGVNNLLIECWGAQGWSGGNSGGLGGYVKGELSVSPGDILYIYVGGQGTVATGDHIPMGGGWNGGGNGQNNGVSATVGGGGGASDVRVGGTALTDRIIVAGGGGGSTNNTACTGGDGGGLTGSTGGGDYTPGTGGSQSAGGTTGGALGQGGNATTDMTPWNGGGGGGYYGGGVSVAHGPGGGGSSYIGGVVNGSTSSGVRSGNGYVSITILPSVTTAAVSSIAGITAACGGEVTDTARSNVTARGVCWNTSGKPTIANSKTTDGAGMGIFSCSMTGLSEGTTYYVRAYATNSDGTGYGSELSFQTLSRPSTFTSVITDITETSATGGGNIISDGGAAVTARGICWNTTGSPNIFDDSYTSNGTGTGVFVSYMTGLAPGTTYYVRAYGRNSVAIDYGAERSFTTGKYAQTITFDALPAKTYGDTAFDLSATGGASGNPVTFTSSDITVATCTGINGATVTILNAGNTEITANQAGNTGYLDAAPVSRSLSINPKSIAIMNVTANDKVYDGTTDVTLTGGSLDGLVTGDTVTIMEGTGAFSDKNAGTGKTINVSGFSITGVDADNYTLSGQPTGITADITQAELTVSGVAANNKVYDGTTDATLTGGALENVIAPDVVTLVSGTGEFADENAGEAIQIVVSGFSIDGADAGNYTVTQPAGLTANITQASLTATADDKSRKEGEANPEFTISYSGFVHEETDDVLDTKPLAACAANESSAPGDYDITVSGGADNNYSFTYVNGTLTVTPGTGIADADNSGYKVYPNPASDFLMVTCPDGSVRYARILDFSGQLVNQCEVINGQIDLQSITPGMYILEIDNSRFKFIKQ